MAETRDAYVQKLKAKVDEWNAEVDKLAAKADQAKADTKIEYQKQIEELRAKQRQVEGRIEEIRQAGAGAWEELKTGTESAWKALGAAVKSATSRFK
jgi:uncharacterized coiled-coil DUF342 family protein